MEEPALARAVRIGQIDGMAQHLQTIRSRVTEEFLPDRGRVLEIGPGEGVFDRKQCDWVAVNVSLRGPPSVLADGQALPFRGASFDAVVATEVIEHVRYPFRLLREIRRILKPSGRALMSTPNVATPVNRLALAAFARFPDDETLHETNDVGHIHFFTRKYFRKFVEGEGFSIAREWSHLLQVLPRRYLYNTLLERALPGLAKDIILELRLR